MSDERKTGAGLAAAHGSVLRCRCWDEIGEICDVKATHLVGPYGGKRGIPMPCCTRHAKHYMTVKGVTVIALNDQALRAVGGDFYDGIEWLACWLLDNAEGETITEEQLRPWAAKAWEAHLKRQNAALCEVADKARPN